MPKRKVMESSDSATKTSIEPKRVCQHGAVTRIEEKQVVRSNDKALKLISNKAMSEMTHAKTNTTNRRTKPQTQLNGKYWKGMAESKDKAVRVGVIAFSPLLPRFSIFRYGSIAF